MRAFRAVLAAVSSFALVASAQAQGIVQQAGAVTSFHTPSWSGNGVVIDGGTPQAPAVDDIGMFAGATCPFGISSQTGPGVSLTPYGQLQICQSLTTTTFVVQGVNGASTPNVVFNIGGVNYPFPGPGNGTVTGPVSTTNNDLACWNGTSGTVLKDCGAGPTITVNAQTGTTYTVLASDAGKLVTFNNGSSIAVTLPQATSAFGAGYSTILCDIGSGVATVTPTTSNIGGLTAYTLQPSNCVQTVSDGSNYQIVPGQGQKNATFGTLAILGASTGKTSLTSGLTGASNNSLALPITASDTLAALGTAQSWTAAQTFTNSDLKLLGSSTGATTFTSANAGASNFTLTAPAVTDTLATIGTAQTFTAAQTFPNIELSASGSATGDGLYNGATHEVDVSVNGSKVAGFTASGPNAVAAYNLNGVLALSATAPTIASGFGSSPSIVNSNGAFAFTVNVGTSNTGTGVLTMPAAAHGWACHVNDITTKSANVATTQENVTGTTSVTVQNYSDVMATHVWVDSDVLQFLCAPY